MRQLRSSLHGTRRLSGVQTLLPVALSALALSLTAVPDTASAQSQPAPNRSQAPSVSLSEADSAARSAPRRGLRVSPSGRWGLDFNLSQPVGREARWGDVEAGAYYRVNPNLRVGASAGLAEPERDPARGRESDSRSQPRVRLESIFRF